MAAVAVIELRRYVLHEGQRDVLIELFDRALVEPQEEVGMAILGQFRDLDDSDRFVWLRGFSDMESRHAALSAFYGGPVWAAHREAANATMMAFDDVRLLRAAPVGVGLGALSSPVSGRPPVGTATVPRALVAATTYPLREPATADVVDRVVALGELVEELGGRRLALLQTEAARNTFTALPVREGAEVLVALDRHDDADAHARARDQLEEDRRWQSLQHDVLAHLAGPPEVQRLAPTARSLLR